MASRFTSRMGVGYSVLQCKSVMSSLPPSSSTRSASSISERALMPVDKMSGLFERRHFFEVRQVRDLARGDLPHGHVERREEVDAREVERRREVLDADLLTIGRELAVRFKAEVDAPHHLELALARAGLRLLVVGLFGEFAHDLLGHGRLVFHDVGPGPLCGQRHLLCAREAAVVVDARLGDDQNGHGCLFLPFSAAARAAGACSQAPRAGPCPSSSAR